MIYEHPDMLSQQRECFIGKAGTNLPPEIRKQVSIGVLNVAASKIPIEAIRFLGANPILSALYVAN